MRAALLPSCAVAWAMSMGAGCPPTTTTTATTGETIRAVSFECRRAADGTQRPNDVDERYELGPDGLLRYSAYFRSMPIEMNHNDDATWNSVVHGERVAAAARALLAGRPGGARQLGEAERAPPCVYILSVDSQRGSTTWLVERTTPDAWRAIDEPFTALIAIFERATGRPIKPHDLPQAR